MKLLGAGKGLVRAFDAAVGGFVVGQQAHEGQRFRASTAALAVAIPLLWKRRFFSLAIGAAAALLAYRYADDLSELLPHDPTAQQARIEPPGTPSMN